MKSYTSTQLKQNTKQVIDEVIRSNKPAVVSTYGEPKLIMIKYDDSIISNEKVDKKKLKKYMVKLGKKTDTSKMFREMRDEK